MHPLAPEDSHPELVPWHCSGKALGSLANQVAVGGCSTVLPLPADLLVLGVCRESST